MRVKAEAMVRQGTLHHRPFFEETGLAQPLPLETVIQSEREEVGVAAQNRAQDAVVIARPRESSFIKRFDGTTCGR
ncbi:MAG: hypothetical protein ACYC6G_17730 [Desulfobaccales bacterium]